MSIKIEYSHFNLHEIISISVVSSECFNQVMSFPLVQRFVSCKSQANLSIRHFLKLAKGKQTIILELNWTILWNLFLFCYFVTFASLKMLSMCILLKKKNSSVFDRCERPLNINGIWTSLDAKILLIILPWSVILLSPALKIFFWFHQIWYLHKHLKCGRLTFFVCTLQKA